MIMCSGDTYIALEVDGISFGVSNFELWRSIQS